jgi:hypothetical protein
MTNNEMVEKVLASLGSLNRRLDKLESRQRANRADAEAAERKAMREAVYADSVERQTRFASFQSRAVDALEPFSVRAPAPVAGESARDYAIRVLELCQSYIPPSNPLSNVRLRLLDNEILNTFRPQIFKAIADAAFSPESVPEGEIRERVQVDPNTGHKQRIFIGERSFIHDLAAANRHARIREPHEFKGRAFE